MLARAAAHRARVGREVGGRGRLGRRAAGPRAPPSLRFGRREPAAAEEPGAAAEAARRLGVPPERLAAFAEVYGHARRARRRRAGRACSRRCAARPRSRRRSTRPTRAPTTTAAGSSTAARAATRARARARARRRVVRPLLGEGRDALSPPRRDRRRPRLRAARARAAPRCSAPTAPSASRRACARARADDEHLAPRARAYPCAARAPPLAANRLARGASLSLSGENAEASLSLPARRYAFSRKLAVMLRCGPSPGLSRPRARPRIAESDSFFRASLSRYRRRYGEPLLEARATAPASLAGRLPRLRLAPGRRRGARLDARARARRRRRGRARVPRAARARARAARGRGRARRRARARQGRARRQRRERARARAVRAARLPLRAARAPVVARLGRRRRRRRRGQARPLLLPPNADISELAP